MNSIASREPIHLVHMRSTCTGDLFFHLDVIAPFHTIRWTYLEIILLGIQWPGDLHSILTQLQLGSGNSHLYCPSLQFDPIHLFLAWTCDTIGVVDDAFSLWTCAAIRDDHQPIFRGTLVDHDSRLSNRGLVVTFIYLYWLLANQYGYADRCFQ